MKNGQWGTVCDDSFEFTDAHAICKLLGFAAGVVDETVGEQGTGRIWLDEVS